MAVWLGQVTVGLTGRIDEATTPSLAILRSVGIGNLGSSKAYAGKPSRLIMTTVRRGFFVAACRKAGTTQAARTNAHHHRRLSLIESRSLKPAAESGTSCPRLTT